MANIHIDQIPIIENAGERTKIAEIPLGAEDEYTVKPNFRLFEVTLLDSDVTIHIRQEPLPAPEQGDFFAVFSNQGALPRTHIETRFASAQEDLIARVACLAVDHHRT